mmetsp:Transcript_8368/g.18090  ORF Transcript_8368/g.18090 Transcript_8368/m.18090 type:complete len:285 (+) Transcript_8368:214-1068(+)|eukprot:CAMPEP_0172535482 /NCGR_PEP_ID=MMETSP1067-20121228/7474_1 /TAXON_ID=265564 ORGANISM="Thalassiosira punctigera, Strain Tpunct2005C2" /NCGR_SAMPLE_ID=MMETSP1067 /ASSEMBLY_ACC=CAM_ASM_000444 /LENGTH=284 /DNA_ID=CAMNT_0013320417 /DNA_START=207 /DNA_END=1061 /DNA_ORIENTATION=+
MAPITVASADDDANHDLGVDGTLVVSKEKLERHYADPLFPPSAVASEGRDDDDDASAGTGDFVGSLNQVDETTAGRRQSNLFVDENVVVNGSAEQFPSILPPESSFATHGGGLALMPSCTSSCENSLASMENVDLGTQLFDDFALIKSQMDADEELARQLQEEEDKVNMWKKPKASKAKPVANTFDSLFGAPSPWEMKSNYAKVEKNENPNLESEVKSNDNSGTGSDVPDSISISGGISMLTKSFKRWGGGFTTAATDFFGEDIAMQGKRPPSKNGSGHNRNAV